MLRFPDDTQTRVNGLDEGGGGEHYWGQWGGQEHDLEGLVGVDGMDLGGDMVYGGWTTSYYVWGYLFTGGYLDRLSTAVFKNHLITQMWKQVIRALDAPNPKMCEWGYLYAEHYKWLYSLCNGNRQPKTQAVPISL